MPRFAEIDLNAELDDSEDTIPLDDSDPAEAWAQMAQLPMVSPETQRLAAILQRRAR